MVEKKKTTTAKSKAAAKSVKKAVPAVKKASVKKTAVKKAPASKKKAVVSKKNAVKVETKSVAKAKETSKKGCSCSCVGKTVLFIVVMAVVVAGLYWLYCCTSSPRAEFLSTCQKSEDECTCMADYMNENLTKAEFEQAIAVLNSEKPEQYLVPGIFAGDKIAQVVTRGTLLCMRE